MMAWKAWVESMDQAMVNPSAVSANETRKTVSTTSRKLGQAEMYADQGSESQKDQALNRRQRGAAQHLAQHDRRARHRSHQHRQQKAFLAVFDHRHHGEDRSEQHDHDQRARIKIIQIVLLSGRVAGTKRTAKAGPDDHPEQQRRRDDSHDASALAIEADQFPPPKRKRRQQEPCGWSGLRREACTLGGHVSSFSAPAAPSSGMNFLRASRNTFRKSMPERASMMMLMKRPSTVVIIPF